MRHLAKDSEDFVRSEVAKNPFTPVSVLEVLSKNPNLDIRLSLVDNPSIPLHVQTRLLEKLASSRNSWVREEVSGRTASPPEVLEVLSKDRDDQVRLRVARNSSTPGVVLETFSKDISRFIRYHVAGNSSAPFRVLVDLSKDSDDGVRFVVAKNPSTPVAVLEDLCKDSKAIVRLGVGKNTGTPESVLEVLAKDSEMDVRRVVSENSSAPILVLEALSKDSHFEVRRGVAANTSAPDHVLSSLASDRAWQVRSAVASNPVASVDTRDQSLRHWVIRLQRASLREKSIREGRAPSPQVPISPADLVRALNWLECIPSDADNKALTKASRSKDWLTRFGVALHPSATEGMLKLLIHDSDPDVAAAARIQSVELDKSAS